jgi:integral membrane protein
VNVGWEAPPDPRRPVFRAPLNLFRTLAIAEAISWTLLITGLILRATADLAIAVTIGGGIHGFVFLSYGATAILVAKNQRWGAWPTIVAIGSAIVPYATIPTELWLHRSGRLQGDWRLVATDDPRDAAWHDRLMRWFLKRPWVLGALIALAVVVLFVVLLIVGPPGGRD